MNLKRIFLLVILSAVALSQSQLHLSNCVGAACTNFLVAGPTGALTATSTTIDINTSAVPQLTQAVAPFTAGQVFQAPWNYCLDTGAVNALACNLAPPISAYAVGTHYYVKAATANTGAATVALNGLSAIPIKKQTNVALVSGDYIIGTVLDLVYDGLNMQWQSETVSVPVSLSPAVVTTAGLGYECLSIAGWCGSGTATNASIFAALTPRYQQFVLHDQAKFTQLATFISTPDSTPVGSCGGAACGFAAAIYDSTCTKVANSDLTTTQSMGSSAKQLYPFATPVTLNPGVYYLGYATDSITVRFYATDTTTLVVSLLNQQAAANGRFFEGANLATGHNSTVAMPGSCGTKTLKSDATQPEIFMALP